MTRPRANGATGPWLAGAKAVLAGSVLQIIFASVVAIVTKQSLDGGHGKCALNLYPGRVCQFAYVTTGFSLFWSLLFAGVTVLSMRAARTRGAGPVLASPAVGLGLLASFWLLVFAITVTIRGGQATDAGYPGTAARNAVMTLAWLTSILFLLFAALAVVDMAISEKRAQRKDFFLQEVVHHGGEATAVGVGLPT